MIYNVFILSTVKLFISLYSSFLFICFFKINITKINEKNNILDFIIFKII
jgi:hypothetical protein